LEEELLQQIDKRRITNDGIVRAMKMKGIKHCENEFKVKIKGVLESEAVEEEKKDSEVVPMKKRMTVRTDF
jgi:hypothetical protein